LYLSLVRPPALTVTLSSVTPTSDTTEPRGFWGLPIHAAGLRSSRLKYLQRKRPSLPATVSSR